jgi:hypothetical protein
MARFKVPKQVVFGAIPTTATNRMVRMNERIIDRLVFPER